MAAVRRDVLGLLSGAAVATMPLQYFVPAGIRIGHGLLVLLVSLACVLATRRRG